MLSEVTKETVRELSTTNWIPHMFFALSILKSNDSVDLQPDRCTGVVMRGKAARYALLCRMHHQPSDIVPFLIKAMRSHRNFLIERVACAPI